MIRILGIDPGKSGGLALIDGSGDAIAIKMPETERDIYEAICNYEPDRVYIEKVGAMAGQGRVSIWTFGQHYGSLRMALIAAGIPFETVAPGVWQRGMRCLSKGNKNVTKARAQELYPQLRITHATADALLIATWGARQMATGRAA